MNKKRDTQLGNSFLQTGFTFKGIDYKPLSARLLLLLSQAKSPFYFGGDVLRGIIDFLYIASHDSKETFKIINDNKWDETIFEYSENITTDDLNELSELVSKSTDNSSAALVEVRETDSPGKKK